MGEGRLYLVAPSQKLESESQRDSRQQFTKRVAALGYDLQVRRVTELQVASGRETSRRINVLDSHVADEMYREAHVVRVGVFILGSAHVMKDFSKALSQRNAINIERLMRYKAFVGRVNTRDSFEPHIQAWENWPGSTECEGERDPRCLPLHVFESREEWDRLHAADESERFKTVHGPPTRRTDHGGHEWESAKALHGLVPDWIAGTELRAGFHWDVRRVESGQGRLVTCTEVWQLRRGHYCNVYPNGTVRRGQRAGGNSGRRVDLLEPPQEVRNAEPRRPSNKSRRRK